MIVFKMYFTIKQVLVSTKMSDQNSASNTVNLLDVFIAEDELLDDLISETMVVLKASVEPLSQEASDH